MKIATDVLNRLRRAAQVRCRAAVVDPNDIADAINALESPEVPLIFEARFNELHEQLHAAEELCGERLVRIVTLEAASVDLERRLLACQNTERRYIIALKQDLSPIHLELDKANKTIAVLESQLSTLRASFETQKFDDSRQWLDADQSVRVMTGCRELCQFKTVEGEVKFIHVAKCDYQSRSEKASIQARRTKWLEQRVSELTQRNDVLNSALLEIAIAVEKAKKK